MIATAARSSASPGVRALGFGAFGLAGDLLIAALAIAPAWSSAPTLRTVVQQAYAPPALAAHAVLTLGLCALFWRWREALREAPAVPMMLALMLFAGPIGAVVSFVSLSLQQLMPRSWRAAIDGEGDDDDDLGPLRDGVDVDSIEPQSLCEVFRTGTLPQRRRAVALIGSQFHPRFAEALRMAVHDENNAIRVQAGMVLLQLEDVFDKRKSQLEGHGDALLDAHGFGHDNSRLELARLHDLRAYSGLLDADRVKEAQLEALRAYRAHLEVYPDDEEAITAVGRLFIRANQHQLVADWFLQQVREGRTSVTMLTWLAEALYRSRRYDELQEVVATYGERLVRHIPPESPLHAALALWQPGSASGPDSAWTAPRTPANARD